MSTFQGQSHGTKYAGPWKSGLVHAEIPRAGFVRELVSGGKLSVTPKADGIGYFYSATDEDRWVVGYGETRLRSEAKAAAARLLR